MLGSVGSAQVNPDSQPPMPRSQPRLRERRPEAAEGADLERGAAHGRVVLHVAVEVIRDLIVYGDVIHLADGQA